MKKLSALLVFCMALATVFFWPPQADAYYDYWDCGACHGDFRDRSNPYVSLADGSNWGANLHDVHEKNMLNGDCNACHGSNKYPVILDSSAGGDGLAPISCVGCHGREEDAGNDDMSVGRGAGLRQHHTNGGETDCTYCHSDASPANYTPVGENVAPSYYFTPDANHPVKPADPCNPDGGENFAGSPTGLDSDGNNLYLGDDPSCAPAPDLKDVDLESL
jgi:hypothetical protein